MVKESASDAGSIPGSGRSPGGGHGNPLQYSCLEIHGQRSLLGYSPQGCKEPDTPEVTEHARTAYLHPRSFRLTLCVIHINSFFLPRCDFTVVCVHVCLGPKTCPPTHLLSAPPQTLVRGPQACACVHVSEPGSGSSDPRASCGIPSVGGRLPHSTLGVPAVGGGFVSFRI